MEDNFSNNLGLFKFLFQLQIMMYFLFLRRPQQPPQAAPPPPPPPAIQRPRRRHNMWVRPWLLQREERGTYHNIMAELYATDIPGFTNYMRMTPEFFEMIKTRLEPRLARQATNYRAPISVGEKLALTIRYLESHTHHYPVSSGLADPPFPSFYQRSGGPSRMSSPESTSDVLLLQTGGKNWKGNSEETQELWSPVPQLQGVLFHSNVGLGRWAVQIQMGGCWHSWILLRCPDI